MAIKNRKIIRQKYQEEKDICERRQKLMGLAHEKRIQLKRNAAAEKEKLSKIHIISSVDELNEILSKY